MNVTFNTGLRSHRRKLQIYQCHTVTISLTETTFPVFGLFPGSLFFFLFSQFLNLSQLDFPLSPPIRPFSQHLGVWLPKQMGLRGEEKVKQQPKRSSTPWLSLRVARAQVTEGIPTDKTSTDFCMTIKHKLTSQECICLKCPPPTLFPACPICILLDTSHPSLWHTQPDESRILA